MYDWFPEASKGLVECKEFGQDMCFTHKEKWHEGKSCTEVDAIRDLSGGTGWSLTQPGHGNYKRWPNPSRTVVFYKIDGCDYRTCTRYKHEFCWRCMGDWYYYTASKCIWSANYDGNSRMRSLCRS